MEKIVLKKKDGKISVMNYTPSVENKLEDGSLIHICWGNCGAEFCKNASPNGCQKVSDRYKKAIDQYDFITDGIQVISKRYDKAKEKDVAKVEDFIVTGCRNYEPIGEKKLTSEDKRRIRSAKESLRTLYFGAGSVDEAYVMQYMEKVHGQITRIYGKTLSENTILDKISEQRDAEHLLTEMLIYKVKELIKGTYTLKKELSRVYGEQKLNKMLNDNDLELADARKMLEIADKYVTEMQKENEGNASSGLYKYIKGDIDFVKKVEKRYLEKVAEREFRENKERKVIDDLVQKGIKEKKIVK